jgi:copper resistance protein B
MRRALLTTLLVVVSSLPASAQVVSPSTDHDHQAPAVHQHGEAQEAPAAVDLPPFVPPLTDADRVAAFPDVHGHAMHDNDVNSYVLFNRLEWNIRSGADAYAWDTRGWVGRDLDRFWFRTEGTGDQGGLSGANAEALYGRAMSRWWTVVGGVRQDLDPGPAQTWAAVGVQGLAPYWFDVEATAYIGGSGRTEFRFETEYSFLLTNRLILQPLVELSVFGKDDPERQVGRGISSLDAGLRLRYEFHRQVAPYVGFTWDRAFFGTADYQTAAGAPVSRTGVVIGLRVWM